MLLVLFAPDDFIPHKAKGPISLEESLVKAAWAKAAREQALAIIRVMRDRGPFEACLICREGSESAREAARQSLPSLSLRSGTHPLDLFKLWRWQQKIPQMLILSMDAASMKTAKKLAGMRKKASTPLICAFLLRAPHLSRKELGILAHAAFIIGGSDYIIEILAKAMDKQGKLSWPGSRIVQPGIAYESYLSAKSWQEEGGKNFIFGMAESLQPKSGALLVIRAMSALWQKENLPPFEIRMFGAGTRFAEILEEAKNLGVLSRLSLLSEQDLSESLCQCHAWLAPGAGMEELPATLWAGFAAKVPVICTQSSLHKERLIGLRKGAIRVEENDPQKLAKAMISIMGDAELRENLCKNVEKELDLIGLNRMAKEIGETLLSILAEKPLTKASIRDDNFEDEEKEPELRHDT